MNKWQPSLQKESNSHYSWKLWKEVQNISEYKVTENWYSVGARNSPRAERVDLVAAEIQIRMANDSAVLGGVTPGAKQTRCYGSAQRGPNMSLAVTAESYGHSRDGYKWKQITVRLWSSLSHTQRVSHPHANCHAQTHVRQKKKEHVEDKQTQINIAVTKEVQLFIRFI